MGTGKGKWYRVGVIQPRRSRAVAKSAAYASAFSAADTRQRAVAAEPPADSGAKFGWVYFRRRFDEDTAPKLPVEEVVKNGRSSAEVILPTDDGQSDQAIVDSSKASGAT